MALARVTKALQSQIFLHQWLVVFIMYLGQLVLVVVAMTVVGEQGKEYTLEISKVKRLQGKNDFIQVSTVLFVQL